MRETPSPVADSWSPPVADSRSPPVSSREMRETPPSPVADSRSPPASLEPKTSLSRKGWSNLKKELGVKPLDNEGLRRKMSRLTSNPVLQGSKESAINGRTGEQESGHVSRLEDEMNNDHLSKLQEIFEEADEDGGGGLDIDEFRQAMRKIMGEGMVDDHELAIVFMKVDANCDGTVDWDEYLSYMLFEYQERDLMCNLFKDIPFPRPLREIASNHRDTITKVAFYQTISHRHGAMKEEEHGGRYISVSKEGVVNFWTTDMHHIRSATIEQPREKTKPMWLTDLVCMSNVNMISISSTERDISFYDINASKFDKCFQVTGLEYPALTMDYWFDKKNMNNAVLMFGDSAGGVSAIIFTEALGSALFGQQNAKSVGSRRVPFPELLKGTVKGVKAVRFSPLHDDWVRKVKYCDNLHSFVSCSTTNDTSLYIGHLDGKKSGSFFKLRKGVLCFDYCKDNNIIVTGGMDRAVRIWNPYVTTKATGMMKGHTSAVTNVVVNGQHSQIITVGKDKGIKVWDMRDQTCLQTINPRNINIGPHMINTVCFHAKTGSLILGTNQLALLEHKWEIEGEDEEVTSHNKPITEAIYNSLFNQVVSSCHDSVVSVWDIMTGLKTIQFANAHKYVEKGVEKCAEITAMTFDPSGRRLVTGGRNGTVKIWNFNNGACLRELENFDTFEVTGIVVPRQRIVTAGWNRRVTTYIDSDEDDDSRQWESKHKEDILSLSYYDPSIIATSSYDGDIYIWSLETAHALCKLNANESVKAQSVGHTATSTFMDRQESKQSFPQNEGSTADFDKQSSNLKLSQLKSGNTCDKSDDGQSVSRSVGRKSTRGSFTADDAGSLAKVKRHSATSLPAINTNSRNSIIEDHNTENCSSRPDSSRTFVTEDAEESGSHESLKEKIALDKMAGKSSGFFIDADNYEEYSRKHEASVDKVLFLQTRPNDKDTATLMASGAEGWVRAWSIHHKGGLLGQFTASHKPNEAVVAMTTDSNNEYLITGDTLGYIKVWDITEYCITTDARRKTSASDETAKRRSRFPYCKQSDNLKSLMRKLDVKALSGFRPPPSTTNPEKTLKWPPKLNSFRAHLASITSIAYAEDKRLLITCSSDCSVRLWTICGRYIGTFGQNGGWPKLTIEPENMTRRMPRDVQRVASALTLKVMNGGIRSRWRLAKNIMMIISRNQKADDTELDSSFDPAQLDEEEEDSKKSARGTSSILGKSYKPKTRHKIPPTLPDIKHNQNQVVVYSSLPFTNLAPIKEITVPVTLQEMHLRHHQSSDAVENNASGGKGAGKRSRLQEFLNKQRTKALISRAGKHAVHFSNKK